MGVVHRDIKPENMVFQCEEDYSSLKIIDFGLAIYEAEKHKLCLCGTPGYIAPEVFGQTSDVFTTKFDLFSAGAIFFKL
jgi:serine/threonine protein kinase